jgi:hypothetical protein
MKMKTSFMPHLASMTPSRTAMPFGTHSLMTPSASRAPSTSLTNSGIVPHATDASKPSILQGVAATKPSSSIISTSRTSDIKCHHCHGIGNFQRDCHSKKSYIATADRGYVSASDTKDDFTLQTNHTGDLIDNDDDAQLFRNEHIAE